MRKSNYLTVWELVLLFASILVFRSVWTLLDGMAWASSKTGLLVLLGIGFVATVVALKAINKD